MQAGVPVELGTEKIRKLLLQYAVPSIIAMSCSSLYNLVDSIFIGQFAGGYALAGLALTFPLMNLGTAFSSMIAVGASANIGDLNGFHSISPFHARAVRAYSRGEMPYSDLNAR